MRHEQIAGQLFGCSGFGQGRKLNSRVLASPSLGTGSNASPRTLARPIPVPLTDIIMPFATVDKTGSAPYISVLVHLRGEPLLLVLNVRSLIWDKNMPRREN